MKYANLSANSRKEHGRGASRRLRHEGPVPGRRRVLDAAVHRRAAAVRLGHRHHGEGHGRVHHREQNAAVRLRRRGPADLRIGRERGTGMAVERLMKVNANDPVERIVIEPGERVSGDVQDSGFQSANARGSKGSGRALARRWRRRSRGGPRPRIERADRPDRRRRGGGR